MAKIGDRVRYLNDVGGGIIVRIKGDMAFVDDDGFETPVLLRECVVVEEAATTMAKVEKVPVLQSSSKNNTANNSNTRISQPQAYVQDFDNTGAYGKLARNQENENLNIDASRPLKVEKFNVVLGFEPTDRLAMSRTDYDATLINDSDYHLYFVLSARKADEDLVTCQYAGVVEPDTELWLGTYGHDEVASLERFTLQYLAFDPARPYAKTVPGNVEIKVDSTKFFKLHCFQKNLYFQNDVLAFTFVKDGQNRQEEKLTFENLKDKYKFTGVENKTKDRNDKKSLTNNRPNTASSRKDKTVTNVNQPLVVDLHIENLVDNLAGMGPAEMLNMQIDEFRKIMDENLKNFGQKIIFIHGKGEGVLRHAILKELNHRYKGHSVQDASFQEYGYGATQVTIRQYPEKFVKTASKSIS